MRSLPKLLLFLSLVVLSAGPVTAETTPHQKLLRSTGMVFVLKDNNQYALGTCWVFHREQRLVVTNEHVVGTHKNVRVYFPSYQKDGQLITHSASYFRDEAYCAGRVLATDVKRDLALVQLDRLPAGIQALPLAEQSAAAGQLVYSLGNSGMANRPLDNGTMWTSKQGKVVRVLFRVINSLNSPHRLEARVLDTEHLTTQGDSGGPLVDARGRLVGVARGYHPEMKIGFSVDVSELRDFLEQVRATPNQSAAVNPLVGFWTLSFHQNGEQKFLGMKFRADGTCEFDAQQPAPGTYSYADGVLTLVVPALGIRDAVRLNWPSTGGFTFVSTQIEFVAERR